MRWEYSVRISICLCQHGLSMLHAHHIMAVGSSTQCTGTLEMLGNMTSIVRILTLLPHCLVCTQQATMTDNTNGDSERITLRIVNGTHYLAVRSQDQTHTLALCPTGQATAGYYAPL